MRSFPSDLSIASPAAIALAALDAALAKQKLNVDARRAKLDRAPRRAARERSRRTRRRDRAQRRDIQRRGRRGGRRRRGHLQRISASLDHCAREKPGTFYGLSRRRRTRLGARRRDRREARGAGEIRGRDHRRRRLHVRQSDRRATGSPTNSTCRCSRSSSTTAAMARCGARRSRCSRTARPARTTASSSPTSRPRRRSRNSCARRAATASASKHHAELAPALARARDAVRGGKQAAGQRPHSQLTGANSLMRIDAYKHFFPAKYFQAADRQQGARYRQARERGAGDP